MKNFLMFFALLVLLVAQLSYCDRLFLKLNRHFCLRYVLSTLPRNDEGEPLNATAAKALNQPYHYWTKGQQSFIFLSEDGQYIAKLARFHSTLRPLYFLNHPKMWLDPARRIIKQQQDNQSAFNHAESYAYASEKLQAFTQLLFAHPLKTPLNGRTLTIYDATGIRYELPAEQLHFVLQPKGERLFTVLDEYLTTHAYEAATNLVHDVLNLFAHMWRTGYEDRDAILEKNYGVLNGKPFIMDVGALHPIDSQICLKNYLTHYTASLREKLEHDCPKLLDSYAEHLEKLVHCPCL